MNEEQVSKDKMFSEMVGILGHEVAADFYISLANVRDYCKNGYAVSYARAVPQSYMEAGLRGVKVQLLYILSNMQYCRGAKDKEARSCFKNVRRILEEAGY